MFRPFYAFIGLRYTHVRRKNHFISFISLMSVLGIALGVGVLIAVLSVMNGFNREIRAQMLSGTPHITVGKIGDNLLHWQSTIKQIRKHPKIVGATPYIYNQGMLSSLNSGRVQGVLIRGIDQKQINEVYPLAEHLTKGNLKNLRSGEFGIILGKSIANYFGVTVGDKVSLITPEASVTPAGFLPRIKRFTVVGIFKIGDLYDDKQAFIDIKDADKLFRMHGAVNGIQLKVVDELEAPHIARDLQRNLKEDYWVMDWTQEFGNFFKALQIQKTVMTFILLLIIAVAAFNLVSSLVMMVSDKRSDIAILRTLGASKRSIMGIFIAQGSIIGLVGTALGVAFGLFLALNVTGWVDKIQETFNVELVAKDVYLVGFLPSEIHQIDIVYIVILALVMCFIATLYPAWRAASIQPAEALRYE
ncbi:MAG TPA: lipoprotein-releasing ABC transporter permease subunit [Gammaproteobacteria bacterium]|nr:lipoprotein-releasing ABC transporter permease subunit [Gammaproteobacteria bacterium]